MLKKLFFLAFLSTSAIANGESLTLSPSELTSGTAYISWSENYDQLTSWNLSFELQIAPNASGYIFQTRKASYTLPYLSLNLQDGKLHVEYREKYSTSTPAVTLLENSSSITDSDKSYAISLSFISQTDQNNETISGLLSLTVNDTTTTSVITDTAYLSTSILHKNSTNTTYCYLTANNGNTELTNISLTRLASLSIPEPTTATLSLLGLLSLLLRRKRNK